MNTRILVTAEEASKLLSVSLSMVRNLAADGVLERQYIGKGTRNYRVTFASLERYADSLPIDPVTR
ncbi:MULTISPECIES: helix-turn-helix domain-containing protein [unclassified Aeromicrobium]|uniref:helix-turn-helix domain-containing protein n=1 Tax=unclassified Aeromicrobium TaxID=2633570 RepID=UPI00396B1B9F